MSKAVRKQLKHSRSNHTSLLFPLSLRGSAGRGLFGFRWYLTGIFLCVIQIMDYLQIDTLKVEQVEVDVGILPKSHKGMLGLDILRTHDFIVEMDKLELYSPYSVG